MFCKAGFDQCDHLQRDGVGRKSRAWRDVARSAGAKGFAVVLVEIPLLTDGLVALHQHAMTFALLAVKVLHAQRFAAIDMRGKLAYGAEEVAVFTDVQWQAVGCSHGFDRLQHAPVARRRQHKPRRLPASRFSQQTRR